VGLRAPRFSTVTQAPSRATVFHRRLHGITRRSGSRKQQVAKGGSAERRGIPVFCNEFQIVNAGQLGEPSPPNADVVVVKQKSSDNYPVAAQQNFPMFVQINCPGFIAPRLGQSDELMRMNSGIGVVRPREIGGFMRMNSSLLGRGTVC
jgi:hypothetical protein